MTPYTAAMPIRDKNIIMLLWALPIAISLHVFEEFAWPGGLREWIRTYKPRRLKGGSYYVILNAAAIVFAVIIALTASGTAGLSMYLYGVALMAGNAISHLRGTILNKRHCPGTVSGVVLLLPLFAASYWYFVSAGRVNLTLAIVWGCLGIFVGFYVFSVDVRKIDRN